MAIEGETIPKDLRERFESSVRDQVAAEDAMLAVRAEARELRESIEKGNRELADLQRRRHLGEAEAPAVMEVAEKIRRDEILAEGLPQAQKQLQRAMEKHYPAVSEATEAIAAHVGKRIEQLRQDLLAQARLEVDAIWGDLNELRGRVSGSRTVVEHLSSTVWQGRALIEGLEQARFRPSKPTTSIVLEDGRAVAIDSREGRARQTQLLEAAAEAHATPVRRMRTGHDV